MRQKRVEFFAFSTNEYHYRRIPFRRFFVRERAEKWAYVPYRGNAQSDLDAIVLESREALEKWANECLYKIDWKNQLLIYQEPKS